MSYVGNTPVDVVTLPDNIVTQAKMADNSVGTAELIDANVTQSKIATNVVGKGPCFSAYSNVGTVVGTSAYTKILYQVEDFDIGGYYDTGVLQYLPLIAGYYFFSAVASFPAISSPDRGVYIAIFKNGARAIDGCQQPFIPNSGENPTVSGLLFMNGTTDFVDIRAFQTHTAAITSGAPTASKFQGFLVRAA